MVQSDPVSAFPPPPPGAERRAHPRIDVLVQVGLERGDAMMIVSVANLSRGGAFLVHGGDDVALGERVHVHLAAGGLDVVQEAKVVRLSRGTPRGFAVRWLDAQERTLAVIEQLVRDAPR